MTSKFMRYVKQCEDEQSTSTQQPNVQSIYSPRKIELAAAPNEMFSNAPFLSSYMDIIQNRLKFFFPKENQNPSSASNTNKNPLQQPQPIARDFPVSPVDSPVSPHKSPVTTQGLQPPSGTPNLAIPLSPPSNLESSLPKPQSPLNSIRDNAISPQKPPRSSTDQPPTLNAQRFPSPSVERLSTQWTTQKAASWYTSQGFLKGANYINANAVNQVEMWQAATYSPTQIEAELNVGRALKFNVLRVFLHISIYQTEGQDYLDRIDDFLGICEKTGFKAILVLFDSCWNPNFNPGPQPAPRPGIHNSQWVQCPGKNILSNPSTFPKLEDFTKAVITRFATDQRVLMWDLWNEPNNLNTGTYDKDELPNKIAIVTPLVGQVFQWAREIRPSQPLTSGVFEGDWTNDSKLTPIQKIQLDSSDIITFHDYSDVNTFRGRIDSLKRYNRPIICTEYLGRQFGSLFQTHIPIAKQSNVGMVNWGLVNGKTQTDIPWDSYQKPYTDGRPYIWQHDIFYNTYDPYMTQETTFLKSQ